jgi:hypothetical protein
MPPKAIIVAGGGPYEGNHLWEGVERLAEQAYRTLYYRGFTKSNIRLLTFGTPPDFDKNGICDERYADPSCARIQQAITSWAAGATDVVIYLCTHGGNDSLLINGMVSPCQSLDAASLDSWLDTLQPKISGKIIVIIDSCFSGSFVDNLVAPSGGVNRIVICGTGDSQYGYFVNHGSISFSGFFWPRILKGDSVWTAFKKAKEAISFTCTQTAVLNDNGNAVGNDAGDGTISASTYIDAGLIQQLPASGQKVIFVAGAQAASPSGNDPTTAIIKHVATLAYHVLKSRGYSDANIKMLGPSDLPGFDAPATLANLQSAIRSWIPGAAHALIYLVGHGVAGSFKLNASENLTPAAFKSYLDSLQGSYNGKVAVVVDSPFAGSFLTALSPPPVGKTRIVVTSTDAANTANFACSGDFSFSQQFWGEVLDDDSLREVFLSAKNAVRFAYLTQIPVLDDDGNGVGNEKTDGEAARVFII